MREDVWFILVDGKGGHRTTASSVDVSRSHSIDRFRKAVKLEYADSHLKGIAPSDLRVYANKSAFDAENPVPLRSSAVLTGLGADEDNALLVVVPEDQSGKASDSEQARKRKHFEIRNFSTQLQSFANAQLVDECLQSPNDVFLPYPQDKIKKMYVRKCYRDVFDLLLENIKLESFAILGTPGIGKSLFFVYILYRLMKDFKEKTLSLQPNQIVYQTGSSYRCFDLRQQILTITTKIEAELLVNDQDTFYVIDGWSSEPLMSYCVVLFIGSPCSEWYKEFVKQKMAKEWYFPVWTLEELQTCHCYCYPDLSIETFKERYRIYGGDARMAFHKDYSIIVPNAMEVALADVDAVNGVRSFGILTKKLATIHTLLHIIVSSDGLYRFNHVDIASKYVGEQLWQRHSAQMITNLREMFGAIPNEISGHLFEIYEHIVFSIGG